MTLETSYIFVAVGAIATSCIVFINLIIIFIIPCYKKPKFKFIFDNAAPFYRATFGEEQTANIEKAIWIRLAITNVGRSIAKHCLAKMVKITNSDWQIEKRFDPTQLHWSSTDWHYPLPDYHFPTIDLNRGADEFLDLMVTQADDNNIYIGGENGLFSTEVTERRQILNKLSPSKYLLEVIVYGDDVEPVTEYVFLDWRGGNIRDFDVRIENNLKKAKSWIAKTTQQNVKATVGEIKPDVKFRVMFEAFSLNAIGFAWLGVCFLINDWTAWIAGILGGILVIISFILLICSFRTKCAVNAKAILDKSMNIYWMIIYMTAAFTALTVIVLNSQKLPIIYWLVNAMFFFFLVSVISMISDSISRMTFKSLKETSIGGKKPSNLGIYLLWVKANSKNIIILCIFAVAVIVLLVKLIPLGIEAVKEALAFLSSR
ncbi:MAG: hypothetical protein ACYDHZ_07995 [Dehalococcoidia bacterium]